MVKGKIYTDKSNGHKLEFIGVKNNAYCFKDLTSGVAYMFYHEEEYEKYIAPSGRYKVQK